MPYAAVTQIIKLRGNRPSDRIVDAVVMATLNAKSAFSKEHHQLLYDPPGELVTTNNVTP